MMTTYTHVIYILFVTFLNLRIVACLSTWVQESSINIFVLWLHFGYVSQGKFIFSFELQ